MRLFAVDSLLGRVWVPRGWDRRISYPGGGRLVSGLRECGIFLARQSRPVYRDGALVRYELVWASLTHNERVDAGASQQAQQVYGGGSSPAAPSATTYPSVIAVASATLTKGKGDQSLGSASAGVTTNEFTSGGLSRHAVTAPAAGDYTAPASLGGQFTQNLKYTFSSTATQTAYGAGLYDSSTVAGSRLTCEDNFASPASLLSGDSLAVTIQIQN